MPVLELDHAFCMVTQPGHAARRLEDDGRVLDAGQAHRGQGTRNRRLVWREVFFELLWVTDAAQARANPLRLDRRADWMVTGASPIGLAFRGQIDPAQDRPRRAYRRTREPRSSTRRVRTGWS